MKELIDTRKEYLLFFKHYKHWAVYLLIFIIVNFTMWGTAFLYLMKTKPIYSSKFSLSLPGTITYTNINLPERGTASSQAVSPYENTVQDPRENYKIIIENSLISEIAAAKLKMSLEEFGKPKFKILDKTTAMSLEFSGATPNEAKAKSWAFYQAFQERLNILRRNESAQREVKIQKVLRDSKEKLEKAQKQFFDYRNLSGLVSDTQIDELASTLEKLRQQRGEAAVKQQQSAARLRELSANFKISTPEATNSFILQSDQLFRQHLKNYSEAKSSLVLLQSKYLPNHPAVVDLQSKQNLAKSALLARSQSLLGYPISEETLSKLSGDGVQQNFVKDIVTSQVESREFKSTTQEVDKQIYQLEVRLSKLAKHKSNLEALKREMQVNEAVYSSTLASLDVNKSNFYGSYPEIQLLTEPSLPEESSSPKKNLVFLGTGLGSLFSLTAILTIYLRSHSFKFAISKSSRKE
jgi:uncharacterized protein involved in exopolysaccharide biosynthesis